MQKEKDWILTQKTSCIPSLFFTREKSQSQGTLDFDFLSSYLFDYLSSFTSSNSASTTLSFFAPAFPCAPSACCAPAAA